MNRSQAEGLVALVQAYFPRPELPASTVAAWASELEPFEFEAGRKAIRRLAQSSSYPVLADMLAEIHEVTREQVAAEVPPMLPMGEVLASMPDDVREKVKRMHVAWSVDDERREEELKEAWKQRTYAIIHGPRLEGVCDGAGKDVVKVDGKRVCPGCNVEVPDFVFRIPTKKRSEETA